MFSYKYSSLIPVSKIPNVLKIKTYLHIHFRNIIFISYFLYFHRIKNAFLGINRLIRIQKILNATSKLGIFVKRSVSFFWLDFLFDVVSSSYCKATIFSRQGCIDHGRRERSGAFRRHGRRNWKVCPGLWVLNKLIRLICFRLRMIFLTKKDGLKK